MTNFQEHVPATINGCEWCLTITNDKAIIQVSAISRHALKVRRFKWTGEGDQVEPSLVWEETWEVSNRSQAMVCLCNVYFRRGRNNDLCDDCDLSATLTHVREDGSISDEEVASNTSLFYCIRTPMWSILDRLG